MVEQQRSMNVADILAMFKPATTNTPEPSAGATGGFQSMLDQALQTTAAPYEPVTSGPAVADRESPDRQSPPTEAGTQDHAARRDEDARLQKEPRSHADPPPAESRRSDMEEAVLRGIKRQKAAPVTEDALRSDAHPVKDAGTPSSEKARKAREGAVVAGTTAETRRSAQEAMAQDRAVAPVALARTPNPALEGAAAQVQETPKKTQDPRDPVAESSKKPVRVPRSSEDLVQTQALDSSLAGMVAAGTAGRANPVELSKPGREAPATKAGVALADLPPVKDNPALGAAVKDALRLVQDLSGKLGLAGQERATAEVPGSERAAGRKLSRLELLRQERLDPQDNRVRVQGRTEVAARSGDQTHVALPGIRSVRVEDAAITREAVPYNPTMPQAVIHHTITLPTGTPQTLTSYVSMLRTQLRDGLNQDLVGQAKILLQGSDKGEIKLVLHPESLGEVKIHLKLEDSTIGGKIFVENMEVLEVFRDNLGDLKQAFLEGGLDASLLELGLDDRSGAGEDRGQFARQRDEARDQAQGIRVLGDSVPIVRFYDQGDAMVDVVV